MKNEKNNLKSNYMRILNQTYDEKIKMYMKLKKLQIAEMLVNCNNMIDIIKTGNAKTISANIAQSTPKDSEQSSNELIERARLFIVNSKNIKPLPETMANFTNEIIKEIIPNNSKIKAKMKDYAISAHQGHYSGNEPDWHLERGIEWIINHIKNQIK